MGEIEGWRATVVIGLLGLPVAPAAASGDIRIEIRRGNTAIKVDWPVQAAGDCAAWLRDWLR